MVVDYMLSMHKVLDLRPKISWCVYLCIITSMVFSITSLSPCSFQRNPASVCDLRLQNRVCTVFLIASHSNCERHFSCSCSAPTSRQKPRTRFYSPLQLKVSHATRLCPPVQVLWESVWWEQHREPHFLSGWGDLRTLAQLSEWCSTVGKGWKALSVMRYWQDGCCS